MQPHHTTKAHTHTHHTAEDTISEFPLPMPPTQASALLPIVRILPNSYWVLLSARQLCWVTRHVQQHTGLLTPNREPTTEQSMDTTKDQRGEPGVLLRLLKGVEMTQKIIAASPRPTPAGVTAHKSGKHGAHCTACRCSTGLRVHFPSDSGLNFFQEAHSAEPVSVAGLGVFTVQPVLRVSLLCRQLLWKQLCLYYISR